jgi:hypothetical protein
MYINPARDSRQYRHLIRGPASPRDGIPKYMIRDRDATNGGLFKKRRRANEPQMLVARQRTQPHAR